MTDSESCERDQRYMAIAARLAERGLGSTAPNPAVGALVVEPDAGIVLGRGWTQPGGRPHAEPEALARAGARAAGATLYVTLEPCSHFGKSPPCVDAIIAAGVKRVVCGLEDPDPRVAGRGLAKLRDAGIEVTRGVLRDRCHYIALGHILRVTERRPFVQLKMAVDAEGNVPRGGGGQPTWVTGVLSRTRGHMLRARADAILIGHGTLVDDDPELTCRLPGLACRSPVRVVLVGDRPLMVGQYALSTRKGPPVWWIVTSGSPMVDAATKVDGEVISVTSVGGRPWLPAVVEELVARGVTRLLVEGGPTVWQSFDRAGLVDEVALFVARRDRGRASDASVAHFALGQRLPNAKLQIVEHMELETDDLFVFRR